MVKEVYSNDFQHESIIVFTEITEIIHLARRCSRYQLHNINEIHINVQKEAPKYLTTEFFCNLSISDRPYPENKLMILNTHVNNEKNVFFGIFLPKSSTQSDNSAVNYLSISCYGQSSLAWPKCCRQIISLVVGYSIILPEAWPGPNVDVYTEI